MRDLRPCCQKIIASLKEEGCPFRNCFATANGCLSAAFPTASNRFTGSWTASLLFKHRPPNQGCIGREVGEGSGTQKMVR